MYYIVYTVVSFAVAYILLNSSRRDNPHYRPEDPMTPWVDLALFVLALVLWPLGVAAKLLQHLRSDKWFTQIKLSVDLKVWELVMRKSKVCRDTDNLRSCNHQWYWLCFSLHWTTQSTLK